MAGDERDPQAGIRPAPMPSGMTREFWDGARQGKLDRCRLVELDNGAAVGLHIEHDEG